jgi:hypothetical protein
MIKAPLWCLLEDYKQFLMVIPLEAKANTYPKVETSCIMYLYKSLAKHNIILKKTIEQRKIDSWKNTQSA